MGENSGIRILARDDVLYMLQESCATQESLDLSATIKLAREMF